MAGERGNGSRWRVCSPAALYLRPAKPCLLRAPLQLLVVFRPVLESQVLEPLAQLGNLTSLDREVFRHRDIASYSNIRALIAAMDALYEAADCLPEAEALQGGGLRLEVGGMRACTANRACNACDDMSSKTYRSTTACARPLPPCAGFVQHFLMKIRQPYMNARLAVEHSHGPAAQARFAHDSAASQAQAQALLAGQGLMVAGQHLLRGDVAEVIEGQAQLKQEVKEGQAQLQQELAQLKQELAQLKQAVLQPWNVPLAEYG